MNVLLDTHVLLYIYGDHERLSDPARRMLDDPACHLHASAVSIYEIVQKQRLGKLPGAEAFVGDWSGILARDSIALLGLSADEAAVAAGFDGPHRDPFDRMLAAQAIRGDLVILSADAALDGFGVRRLW